MISRLHPSIQTRQRLNLSSLLAAGDLGLATGLSVLNALLFSPDEPWGALLMWIMATWTAWFLTRETRQVLSLGRYSTSVTTPLLAAALALSFAGMMQEPLPLHGVVLTFLALGGGMSVARFAVRRRTPPVLIGVCPGGGQTLPQERRVEYIQLDHADEVQLAALDGLLIGTAEALTPEWLDLILHAQTAGKTIWTPATLNEELHGRVALEHLHTARLSPQDFDDTYAFIKRGLDILAVVLALPLLLPVMAAVAILVALDAGRPILFWQWRVGQRGRPFRIAKFRTMKRDSEVHGAAFASSSDMRVTRVGKFLRKFRLDELPQFWNVLRGDMSIIGPRPEQQAFVEQFEREIRLYPVRHWVKPGITGWAQVTHGYAAGADETTEKLRYDMFYVKHFSFWLDARIVAKTVWTICTGFGAR